MKFSRFVNFSFVFVVLLTFSTIPYTTTHAQGVPVNSNSIVLTASTDNPVPGRTVTIKAESYSFDINSATIIWSVAGKQIQKGVGLTTFEVTAPSLGKKITVSVTAVTIDGVRYTNTLSIGSGSVDMIMETDGYTPPFFKGKMPLVFQNTATIIAVPHLANSAGVEYDPATLVYQWKKDDGKVLQEQSGFGKQSISLKGDIVPRPYYLIVTASTRDGTAQAQGLILVGASSPSVLFYKNDPLYGPFFNLAINNTFRIGSQKEIQAFASLFGFNFSKNINSDLTLSWMINGIEHTELASNKSIILRTPDGSSGTSHIDLQVKGINNILQSADNSFDVSFDAADSEKSTTPINI
ncbi:MAG TPA: hypothetical protein VL335_00325 [Candidatus Paceibacterota bacterium]|jgi:hypothetical protein|nr:hypothetical protein [Candidatus Paceibacterota bacterium]